MKTVTNIVFVGLTGLAVLVLGAAVLWAFVMLQAKLLTMSLLDLFSATVPAVLILVVAACAISYFGKSKATG